MIKNTLKSYKSDNRGSAIITGLVVSTVLMVLCLSLLLVAYSLFFSTSQSTSDLPNREMLYSAAEALEHELLDYTLEYEEGTSPVIDGHELWKYIDNNIWKGFTSSADNENVYTQSVNGDYWLYYDSEDPIEAHRNLENCSRYFYLTSIGSVKIVVQLYWELPKGFDWNIENKNGTVLNAIYRLYDNNGVLLVKTNRKYVYSINKKSDTASDEVQYISTETPPLISPDGGTHYFKYEFDNAVVELFDYYQGHNVNLVIGNNNGKVTKDFCFDIFCKDVESISCNNSNFSIEKLTNDGWYRIRSVSKDHNTISSPQQHYISFGYTGTISSSPIMRQVIQGDNTQNGGNASDQNESISATEFQFIDNSDNRGKITITNTLDKAIENWTIAFTHNGSNYDVENGIKGHDHKSISNTDSNGHLEPNASIDIIINFHGHGNNIQISNISAYTTIASPPAPDIIKIKWNRIGEEIVNPGGDD